MSYYELLASIFLAGLIAGLWIGSLLRDAIWRGKASTGFRMASGGKLYTVQKDRS